MSWLDLSLAAILIVATLKGLLDGFVKQVISIVVIILAAYLSWRYGGDIGVMMFEGILDPIVIKGIGVLFLFTFLLLIGIVSGKVFSHLLDATPLGLLNRLLGGLIGLCGAVIVLGSTIMVWESIHQGLEVAFDYEKHTIYCKLYEFSKTIWGE